MTKAQHRLLLLRPIVQAERFAAELEARFGNSVAVILAPLQEIRPVRFVLPAPSPQGLILTSENAVAACVENPKLMGLPVWCVGIRTADRARASGFQVRGCFPDADALVHGLTGTALPQPWLLARGTHAKGDIAARLVAGGTPCAEIIVYDQADLPIAPEILDDLMRAQRTTVALFSPRSAALFSTALAGFSPSLHIVALSKAVSAAYTGPAGKHVVAAEPTGVAMLEALTGLFADITRG